MDTQLRVNQLYTDYALPHQSNTGNLDTSAIFIFVRVQCFQLSSFKNLFVLSSAGDNAVWWP